MSKPTEKLKEMVSLKIAWGSISFKVLTFLSLTLALTFAFNFYTISNNLNLASMDIQYKNQVENLEVEYQNQLDELTVFYQNQIENLSNQITIAENDETILQNEIEQLKDTVEYYQEELNQLSLRFECKIVRVYGNLPEKNWDQWIESYTFTCNDKVYTATIKDDTYTIYLENWQTYEVEIVYKGTAGITSETKSKTLPLNTEEKFYEMTW